MDVGMEQANKLKMLDSFIRYVSYACCDDEVCCFIFLVFN